MASSSGNLPHPQVRPSRPASPPGFRALHARPSSARDAGLRQAGHVRHGQRVCAGQRGSWTTSPCLLLLPGARTEGLVNAARGVPGGSRQRGDVTRLGGRIGSPHPPSATAGGVSSASGLLRHRDGRRTTPAPGGSRQPAACAAPDHPAHRRRRTPRSPAAACEPEPADERRRGPAITPSGRRQGPFWCPSGDAARPLLRAR
jgi:hypothetical protein